jgi:pimeloyl-ACP methyl ester carboxylesterase
VSTFILVHGSWHDGKAWTKVVERLEQLRHSAFNPTVAGHGKGASRRVDHARATQSVVDYIVDRELSDFVLVGHSSGGSIISKVAEAIPHRVRRLVYVNGLILDSGDSALSVAPPEAQATLQALAAQSSDNSVMLPFEIWRDTFINDGGPELARAAYEQLSPASLDLMSEPVDMTKFYTLATPRSYIRTTEDIVYPPGEWALHPRLSSRLGVYRLLEMPGSHEVMFTNPNGLADRIIEASLD